MKLQSLKPADLVVALRLAEAPEAQTALRHIGGIKDYISQTSAVYAEQMALRTP
jgi:hypothetical protein